MPEEEWLSAHPAQMLARIKKTSPGSIRKLRLLAIAWARYLESLPDWSNSKPASHLGEDLVEGRQSRDYLLNNIPTGPGDNVGTWLITGFVLARDEQLDETIRKSMHYCGEGGWRTARNTIERHAVARSLIRCILSNPFRPMSLDPSWLTFTVVAIAEGIYQERAYDRMPILADALQDAGCENEDILAHCRQPDEHVRGCWVVDLLTGRS
jgi:hypothetical protein